MSLKILETKWKTALTSILEELTGPQFNKLMFNLVKIPQGVKTDKTREEIPYIIIQYYGTEGSITVIDKEMKQLPRNDAAVQEHLRPFVEKLKKQRQKEKQTTKKNASASGSVAKKQKPAAVSVSKPAADSGSVAKKQKPAAETTTKNACASGSVAKKQKPAAVMVSKPAADSGSMAKKQIPAPAETMSMSANASGSVAMQQTSAAFLWTPPDRLQPPMLTTLPDGSGSMSASGSVAKKQTPAADHVGVVKPKQKGEKPAESTKTPKVPSAPVQMGRIKILRLKWSNKTNTHLEVEFNGQPQTFFIKSRHLTNTLGFGVDDDLGLRLFFELPLTADAKIQGNRIIEMKRCK